MSRTIVVMTTTSDPRTVDDQAVEEFAGRLFEAAPAAGPATSAELAIQAGLDERYVREWLGAMATAGIFEYERSIKSSSLEDNIGNPLAPFTYAVSTLHCLTVSLAVGGAGLGTAWGEQVARRMRAEAGFGDVVVHDAPRDLDNAVFVTHRKAA